MLFLAFAGMLDPLEDLIFEIDDLILGSVFYHSL
jgi:hypothetical protein